MLFYRTHAALRLLPRPIKRGPFEAQYQLVVNDTTLGDVRQSGSGYVAFDHARGVWVGPFKRVEALVRFFRSRPGVFKRAHPRWKDRPNVTVVSRWGRAWWLMNVRRWLG